MNMDARRNLKFVHNASGMLCFSSILLMMQGIFRFVQSDPFNVNWSSGVDMCKLLASLAEIIMGMIGLLIGFAVNLFAISTYIWCGWAKLIVAILGFFVIIIYDVTVPQTNRSQGKQPPIFPYDVFSPMEESIAFGLGYVASSIATTLVFNAFQIHLLFLVSFFEQKRFEDASMISRCFAILFSTCIFVIGASMTVLGVLIYLNDHNSHSLYVFPPSVTSYSHLTITSGCVITFHAITLFLTQCDLVSLSGCAWVTFISWMWVVVGHIMVQVGKAGVSYDGMAENLLSVFTVVHIAPLFAIAIYQQVDFENIAMYTTNIHFGLDASPTASPKKRNRV